MATCFVQIKDVNKGQVLGSFMVITVCVMIVVCASFHAMLIVQGNVDLIKKINLCFSYFVIRPLGVSLSFLRATKDFFSNEPISRLQYQQQ